MISIISIINNERIAKDFLLGGLSTQNTNYELCLVNNDKSIYKSASQANNSASAKASGDYLMFVHQDVLLPSKNWLEQAENWLSTESKIGVAGVAGMLKPKFLSEFEICLRYKLMQLLGKGYMWYRQFGRGNVQHGPSMLPGEGRTISEMTKVQTVDELLLIIPANVLEFAKFDETVCNDWHLYGVDLSLTVAEKGYDVCVLPLPVFHKSIGKRTDSYLFTLRKLIEKHKGERIMNTTFGMCPTKRELMELLWSEHPRSIPDWIRALA